MFVKLLISFLFLAILVSSQTSTPAEDVKNPLPQEFIDHLQKNSSGGEDTVSVQKSHVVRMLIGGLKGEGAAGHCDMGSAVKELEDVATTAFGSNTKALRFVRAVTNKFDASCEEIQQLSAILKDTEKEHADKLRRALEDAAVLGNGNSSPATGTGSTTSPNPNINRFVELTLFRGVPPGGAGRFPVGGINPFLVGGGFPGGQPQAFRFGGVGGGGNPFFQVPLTAPALDMDLDRLMFLSTNVLGITGSFELTKALHDLHSPRSEVFDLQERFQNKNMTEAEAAQILADYQDRLKQSQSATPSTPPSTILHNTAELSGLNATESKRFARAISQTLGPSMNSSQAMEIHDALRDMDKNQIMGLTNEIEKVNGGTTTPTGATGHDWIFTGEKGNGNGVKRAVGNTLESTMQMFSSDRACGFSVETASGVVYPWVARLSCHDIQCTGSLISSSLILTSASCILSCGNDALRVTLGDGRVVKHLELQAEAAVVHPSYDSRTPEFDIGLVKLISPIDFNLNPLIYPICLVGVETDDPSIECEVVWSTSIYQHTQPPLPLEKSVVSCYQPGHQVCHSKGFTATGCVQQNTCNTFTAQPSLPVMCRRVNQIPARYYQWGVTTAGENPRPGAGCGCSCGVARISDAIKFIASGLN